MEGDLRSAHVAVWVGAACALALAVALNAGATGGLARSSLVLTALSVLPTALAAGALARRPVLLLPAAFVAIVVGPLLWSGLPLMWVPASLYLWAFTRSPAFGRPPLLPILVPALLALGAIAMWLASLRDTCIASAHGSSCGPTTSGGSLASSVAIAMLACLLGWRLARPSGRARARTSGQS